MAEAEREIEVLQEAPAVTREAVGAAVAAVVFVAAIGWITLKVIGSLLHAVIAAVVLGALAVVPQRFQRQRVLRARRVVADRGAREIRIERRGATEVIGWDDVLSVASDPVLLSDGISLDAVTIARKSGPTLSFSALDRSAAEGIARSLRAVVGLDLPASTPPSV